MIVPNSIQAPNSPFPAKTAVFPSTIVYKKRVGTRGPDPFWRSAFAFSLFAYLCLKALLHDHNLDHVSISSFLNLEEVCTRSLLAQINLNFLVNHVTAGEARNLLAVYVKN